MIVYSRLAFFIVAITFALGACSKKPAAPQPIPPGGYVVSDGNSLSRIAIRAYGDMNLWRSLLNANPQLKKRPKFGLEVGETIIVPEKSKLDMRQPTPEYPTQLPADYVMLPGDSLRSIAKGCYGDEESWTIVYEANRAKLSSRLKEDPGKPIPAAIEGVPVKIPAKGDAPKTAIPATTDKKKDA